MAKRPDISNVDKSEKKFDTDVFELGVDCALIMEFPRIKPGAHFRSRLLGYKNKSTIMVTLPSDGKDPLPIIYNDSCTVRYMDGQNACAFETGVQHICKEPFPYLHLYYPPLISCIQLREVYRLPINLPVIVSIFGDEQHHSGVVIDMSPLGVGFLSSSKFAQVGDVITLDIALSNGEVLQLETEVRNINNKASFPDSGEPAFRYGTKFVKTTAAQTAAINEALFNQVKPTVTA